MKRFKFRLQTLLDQRKAREERLLWELSDLQREELREIERLHGLERILRKARESIEEALSSLCSGGFGILPVVQRDEFAKATRDDIRVQELTIEAVGRRVEAKRVEVVKAMQDRKVLEALKDKQEREYIVSMARQEQNQLDEMATVRYARGI